MGANPIPFDPGVRGRRVLPAFTGPWHHGLMKDLNSPETLRQLLNDGRIVRLGVSSCLLGHEVRYDGGHKWDQYLVEVLGPRVEWVAVCPEAEIGLGIPRPPIQLEGRANAPQLIMPSTGDDLTEAMKAFALKQVTELRLLGIAGFVFKGRSPSCGMEGVKVFEPGGRVTTSGIGAFARILMDQWPELPVVDEVGLGDPDTRTGYLEKVFR